MSGPFVVVGGGVTGLAAAFEFVRQGRDVMLVEAADRLGGKVHTEQRDGFLLEHGPDSFVSYKPGAMTMAADLGVDDQIVGILPPRVVSLRVRGRMEPIPEGMGMVLPTRLGPFARTRILTWPEKLRALADLVMPRVLGEDDMAIGELLRRRVGRGVAERFADPLVGGIYGATVDELSVDAVLPMLRGYEAEHRSLVLASLRSANRVSRPGDSAGSPFRTLRRGMGQLVDAIAAELVADPRAEVRTGVRVDTVEPTADGVRVGLADGSAIDAAGVVLAGGVASSAALTAGIAPVAAEALRSIPLGSTRSVYLGYDLDAFAEAPVGHGYLEAGPERAPITGITLSSLKWPGRAPDGTVLVRAFVPDRVGAAAGLDDGPLLDAVTDHVAGILGARSAPLLRHLVRWTDAMPAYTVGHPGRVAAVDGALSATPVRVAGSAIHGVGVPECLADGRRTALALVERNAAGVAS